MSGAEVAALVVAVAATLALCLLLAVTWALVRAARDLRDGVTRLQAETEALVAELAANAAATERELERIDRVFAAAESVTDTMDNASRLAYRTVGSPVVKGMALATGANQAYRRFRDVRRDDR